MIADVSDAKAEAGPLLEVRDLKVYFPVRGGLLGRYVASVKAVDGVSFRIGRGETLALVGESGCGKSTTGYAVMGMQRTDAGTIVFDGKRIDSHGVSRHAPSAQDMQLIYQDPESALNPRLSIGESIGEPLINQAGLSAKARNDRIRELLDLVGLLPAHADRRPAQLSGGQRQRVVIARALALEPRLIICDEAVSALDVSIQSQILNLLTDLQRKLGLSYLFISHDLSVVRHISDRVAVMYFGRIVEDGPVDAIFENPQHPYTRALLDAVPRLDPSRARNRRRKLLPGELPDPLNPPQGCAFVGRCPFAEDTCSVSIPELLPDSGLHRAACPILFR